MLLPTVTRTSATPWRWIRRGRVFSLAGPFRWSQARSASRGAPTSIGGAPAARRQFGWRKESRSRRGGRADLLVATADRGASGSLRFHSAAAISDLRRRLLQQPNALAIGPTTRWASLDVWRPPTASCYSRYYDRADDKVERMESHGWRIRRPACLEFGMRRRRIADLVRMRQNNNGLRTSSEQREAAPRAFAPVRPCTSAPFGAGRRLSCVGRG
jgi:hypothetical protein